MIEWLTRYDAWKIELLIDDKVIFEAFFQACDLNENGHLITGSICGYRVEEIEDLFMRKCRYLGKISMNWRREKRWRKFSEKPIELIEK